MLLLKKCLLFDCPMPYIACQVYSAALKGISLSFVWGWVER